MDKANKNAILIVIALAILVWGVKTDFSFTGAALEPTTACVDLNPTLTPCASTTAGDFCYGNEIRRGHTVKFFQPSTTYCAIGPMPCYSFVSTCSAGTTCVESGETASCVVNLPNPPATLTVTTPAIAPDTSIIISWSSVSGATSYKLYRGPALIGPFTVITTTSSLSYLDIGLTPSTTYYYKVSAVNAGGESPSTGVQAATTTAPPALPKPSPRVGLTSTRSIELIWVNVPGYLTPSYNVYRGDSMTGPFTLTVPNSVNYDSVADETHWIDAPLTASTTYYYVVSTGALADGAAPVSALTLPPQCQNGVQDADETGIDCGGSVCPICAGTCSDFIQNQDETGIDCGGAICSACATPSGGSSGGGGGRYTISGGSGTTTTTPEPTTQEPLTNAQKALLVILGGSALWWVFGKKK